MRRPRAAPSPARRAALAVARRLRAAGYEALFCGGAVRDRCLGRQPSDYDVATSAPPEKGARLFPGAILVGARFGVLVVPGEAPVEVATFRDDGLYVDGRRPTEVRYSDAPRDARRRDFTVNALFEDPESGEVLDYVGGLPDLSRRVLRAIGEPAERFREDHLRLLRAIRFAVQLGFAIEPETFRAVQALAPAVATVSRERIQAELLKILRHGRGRGLRLLAESGLLREVLPDVDAMRGSTQPPRFHPEGDVFVHTCLALDGAAVPEDASRDEEEDLLLAVLLHDVGKPPTRTVDADGRIRFNGHDVRSARMAEEILEGLRFPRRRIERVAGLAGAHMRFASLPRMRPARRRRFLGDPAFPLHLRLHEADCSASHGDLSVARWARTELRSYAEEPVLPEPLLQGRDLIRLGYRPGPRFGEILAWLRDEQLEGAVRDAEEAVRRVRERWPPDPVEDGDGNETYR